MINSKRHIAIIGDENTGKSTIWNSIIGIRKALVSSIKGTTRDRLSESIYINEIQVTISDLPGLRQVVKNKQDQNINKLVKDTIQEADFIYIVVDSRYLMPQWIIETIKKLLLNKCPLIIIQTHKDKLTYSKPVNLIEQEKLYFASDIIQGQFQINANQIKESFINSLLETTLKALRLDYSNTDYTPEKEEKVLTKIAVIGRPNSGKSTLINTLSGLNQLTTSELAGTTTDSTTIPITYKGTKYFLVDTAGCRRKKEKKDTLEKISTSDNYLLPIVRNCDILLLLCDGSENFTHQDIFLMNYAFNEARRSTLLVINKSDSDYFKMNKSIIYQKAFKTCNILKQDNIITISAKRGTGIKKLMTKLKHMQVGIDLQKRIPPRKVTFYLQQINKHKTCKNVKLKFAQVTSWNPCHILIHGSNMHNIDSNYKRFLVNSFKSKLNIKNMPLKLIFKDG